eukprot:TRINITY_DN9061_c0_g1_i1.p1 TRINITY_DN9061_c0_g1~~TRINITY_DN9061_c0_g1_i1.p1  ORF type:complete len:298 (-),score=80.79 TRINITY_DN9061_c0_g1_i1:64-957(-)
MAQIAFCGLGLMGAAMAQNVAKSDAVETVHLWNRTTSKSEEVASKNSSKMRVHADLSSAIQASTIVIVMLADYPTVKKVFLEDSIRPLLKSKILVQMSTLSSDQNKDLQREFSQDGVRFIECPVLGSTPVAISGALQLLVGGDEKTVDEVKPILTTMGKVKFQTSIYGKASVLKLSLNQMIASHIAAFGFSLALLEKNEIDSDVFMECLRGSAAHSKYYDLKYDAMKIHDHSSNIAFEERLLTKDIGCMVEEGKKVDLDTQVLEAMNQLGKSGIDLGWGSEDMSAMQEAILKKKKSP